jgi:O-antigen ligase
MGNISSPSLPSRELVVSNQALGYDIPRKKELLSGAFFWLSAFYLVYCLRPEDWIPGLKYIPLAKVTGIAAMLGFLASFGKIKRGFRNLPKEATYLLAMMALLVPGALLSPVWRGGAFFATIEFFKAYIAWMLTFLLITTVARLRRIVFIQAASVGIVSAVAVIKGHSVPRLDGVLGGIYSNPNDLAFAIVLCLPFSLMFLLSSKSGIRKAIWAVLMLFMIAAVFLTASRAGFITLVLSGSVCLWHFGVKGKRPQLIVIVALLGVVMLAAVGGRLKQRFFAISGNVQDNVDQSAYGSYEERSFLMHKSVEGILHYPILGVGVRNFITYSGKWKEVHNTYLQLGVEGGIPVLVLFFMFFARGFRNLRLLRKMRDLDSETVLLGGALHSSLIGFVVGAFFAPEAYQFFPYFAVAYTSVLFAVVKEREPVLQSTISPEAPRELAGSYAGSSLPRPRYR